MRRLLNATPWAAVILSVLLLAPVCSGAAPDAPDESGGETESVIPDVGANPGRDDDAERRAIRWVLKSGGTVSTRIVTPTGERTWDANQKGLPDETIELHGVSFSWNRKIQVDDAGLLNLKGLRKIQSFSVTQQTELTNSSMKLLSELSTLVDIDIRNHHQITDEGLRHFAKLDNLSHLSVSASGLTDAGLGQLKHLPLRYLALSQCKLTNEACEHLSEIKTLRTLALSYARDIDDKGVSRLTQLPKLRSLNLNFTDVSGDVVDHLAEIDSLRTVALIGTPLDDRCLARLAGLDLRGLYIRDTAIGDDALKTVAGYKSLEVVNISDNRITDAGLAHLRHSKSLHTILMQNTLATDGGVATLRGAMPECRILD